jgi:hypothetical protein
MSLKSIAMNGPLSAEQPKKVKSIQPKKLTKKAPPTATITKSPLSAEKARKVKSVVAKKLTRKVPQDKTVMVSPLAKFKNL